MSTIGFREILSGSTQEGLRRSSQRLQALGRGLLLPGEEESRLIVPGLALPHRLAARRSATPAPIDLVATFVTLDDYLKILEPTADAARLTAEIVASHDPHVLLKHLAFLARLAERPQEARGLAMSDTDHLRKDLGEAFEVWMQSVRDEGDEAHLISRQGALAAAREVFRAANFGEGNLETPDLAVAILLVHAVSAGMGEIRENAGKFIGQMPAGLTMEMVRNGLFNDRDNASSVIDRTLRVWQDLATRPMRTQLRAAPRELLAEALGGISFEDFFALGVWLWTHARDWTETVLKNPSEVGRPITLPAALPDVAIERDVVDGFLDRVAAEPKWFASEFEYSEEAYDFLPFQARPVARLGDELLVIDETYLLQKFSTLGLFWAIHDNERDHHGSRYRRAWNHAHGELIELLVTERLRATAPPTRDRPDYGSFYSEEEMKQAYPGSRVGDAAVDYGDYFLLFEVTGGHPVIGTRVAGDLVKFEDDTRKLILDEAEQLHVASQPLLTNQKRLTGYDPPPKRKLVPILVVGGGYPADALSRGYVSEVIAQEGWLKHDAIEPLCILDLPEVEILERLRETGKTPGWLLARWKRSGLRDVGFKDFIVKEVGSDLRRPSRMSDRVVDARAVAFERLLGQKLPEDVKESLRPDS
jgi:hypothetical protein